MCKERKKNLSFSWNEISAKQPNKSFEVCCWDDTWAGTEHPPFHSVKRKPLLLLAIVSHPSPEFWEPFLPQLELACLLLPTNWLPFPVLPRASFHGYVLLSSALCSIVCLPSLVSSSEKGHPISFHNSYHLNTNTPKYTFMFPCHPQVVLFQILSCPSIFLASE